jgi:hypothetical protein
LRSPPWGQGINAWKLPERGLPVASDPIENGSAAPDFGAMKSNLPDRPSAIMATLVTRTLGPWGDTEGRLSQR